MNKNKSLIIIVILAIIVAGVSFFAIHQMQQNKEMSELFAIEKMEMENEYSTFATQYDELQIQINNDSLRVASQLDATNIVTEPLNKRNREARKAKDVKKLAVSFTIVKNITAKTGNKTVYVRIAKPDNEVLTKSDSNTFPYEDRNISYSMKKMIEYTGEEQTVTLYWDVEEFMPSGTYKVYVFADGNMIGQGSFTLK